MKAILTQLTIIVLLLPAVSLGSRDSFDNAIAVPNTGGERHLTEFEQNLGQFDPQVKFAARAAGSMIFLTGDSAMYVLPYEEAGPTAERSTQRFHTVSMNFANARDEIVASGSNASEHRTNYFLGDDASKWRSDIPNYREVRFDNVYDGISVAWYGRENGATQYDFVVAPNADASQIELRFDGADSISLSENGDLLVATPAGTIKQQRPFAYQLGEDSQRVEIPSSFSIDGNTARFNLGEYDRGRELVIDPTVTLNNVPLSTFLGSFADDVVNDIAVDQIGSMYVTGKTLSISFPTTTGTFDTTSNGNEDTFVTRLNGSGTGLIFSTYIGGTFYDEGKGLQVDPQGNIYIVSVASIAYPTTGGAFDTTFNGGSDVALTKLSSTGSSLIFSTYIGTSAIDNVSAIAIDSSGNSYIVGQTSDTVIDFPTTVGAFDTTHNGNEDGYLTKFNDTGTALIYSTFIGGSEIDLATNVSVNTAGEATVAGTTSDGATDLQTTAGAFDTTHNGVTDIFVSRFNAAGSAQLFSTLIGGPGIDNAGGMEIDATGSVYVAGSVSTGYPTTPGAFDTVAGGSSETGVTKLNSSGSALIYSTFLGGTQAETPRGVAVDQFGHAYVAINNFAGDFPTTPGAYDTTFNGASDVAITMLNQSGTGLIYSTYVGSSGSEFPTSIALDQNGNIYIGGQATLGATPYPTTPDAYQSFNGGGADGFITKLGDLSISGKVIDTSGNPLPNVMIAMSGQVSGNLITGSDGRFGFTDTVPGEPHSITAMRSGYTINPSIFNIASLANNRELIFIGTTGPPSGGAGGTLLFENLSYNKGENGNSVTVTVNRTGIISSQTPVTVDWATSNGTATAGQDYVAANGQLSFGPFETSKTISIQLLNDSALEPREAFSITMSNPTNSADIETGRASTTVNVFDEDIKDGSLLISEFRQRGRLGANDEYVKLFNPNDFDVTVNTADGSSGITLARTSGDQAISVVTIPSMVTIRSRGHYLITNNNPSGGFSLIDFPTGVGTTTSAGDQVFSNDIPDNSGLVLLNTANSLFFTQDNAVDRIGFVGSTWAEGSGLVPISPSNFESCFVRKLRIGDLTDTNDNRSDFLLLDNHSRLFSANDGSKVYSVLGSPAPETSESLRMMLPSEVSINEVGTEAYDPIPVPNGVGGTLTVYRQITNNTNAPILALRLRAIDFPTAGSALQRRTSSRPDFRLLSSTDSNGLFGVSLTGERLQPNGGGLNSTLTVDSVTSQSPLLPGQSITVAIRFGVMRWGRHPFTAAIEALQ
ncbi:MAG: SBBP repeat-containing protein [Blastocatellia bacterium]|nr:SBBP repeat-containing protein [Blastocatellia bacterium]